MIESRPTRAQISLSALANNYAAARVLAGDAKLLAVVKAEAYGHGLIRIAQEFVRLGADWLGVSFLEEGIILREQGIDLPILVMGGLVDEQIGSYLDYDLTVTVSSVWKARLVNKIAGSRAKNARVHIKTDTGMGRVGQNWQTTDLLFAEFSKFNHLIFEGIYTHFASSETSDQSFTQEQLTRFGYALESARKQKIEFELIHCANSGALIQLPDAIHCNMVRPGLMLYGYTPSDKLAAQIDLKPVMTLLSRVVFVKKPPAGTPIGYNSTWKSPGNRWIATLPIGYGDGFPRRAGNRAQIMLHNRLCPIVGNVSMDQITIDAGEEAYLGEEAILWGESPSGRLSLWNLCHSIDAIPYELLCGLTSRVPRIYID